MRIALSHVITESTSYWEQIPVPASHVLDLVPDFVGVADRDGRILFVNRAGRRMVGLKENRELKSYYIHDFFPHWTASLETSGNGGDGVEKHVNWKPQAVLRTCDGREIMSAQAVVAHTDERSEISCFTIIARGAFFPAEHHASVRKTDIESVVQESLTVARTTVTESVTIRESFESNNAAVLADPTQIHQMVMNLCLNSAQSMREGGGEISINTSRVSVQGPDQPGSNALRAGNYVRLTIRDNGPGLAPSIAPHVFEPGVAEFSSEEASTGSGLWNVKRTVVDSGGDIFVETAPGRGTAFHVYLPIVGTNGNGTGP